MAEVNTKSCDICGRQKQETNHWLVAITRPGMEGILFLPADAVVSKEERAPDYKSRDLCGQACSTALFQQWLDNLKNLKNLIYPNESEAV
ncbi:MAG TPA: hypothetical protein VGG26_09055 [Terracidiphilus sp.]